MTVNDQGSTRVRARHGRHAAAGTGSTYAKYVGRVGALAVALGVTGAMATSPGIAWADDTSSPSASTGGSNDTSSSGGTTGSTGQASGTQTSSTQTTSTGTTGTSGSTGSSGETGGTTTTTTTSSSTGTTTGGTTTHTGSQTETDLGGGVVIRSSGGSVGGSEDDEKDTKPDTTPAATPSTGQSTSSPTTGEEQPPVEGDDDGESDGTGETSGGSGGTTAPTTEPPHSTSTPTTSNSSSTPTSESAQSTSAPSTSAKATSTAQALEINATGGSSTAQLLSAAAITPTHEHPAATSNPIATFIAQLPTPNEVFQQVKAAVTQCACTIINQALKFVSGLSSTISGLMAPAPGGTGDPAQTPIMWTVLAWVRRQVDYAVSAFNRSPIGHWVHDVTTQITTAIGNFGASPLGRTISARVSQFLQECEGSTALPADLDRIALVGGLTEPTDFDFVTHIDADGHEHTHIVIVEKAGSIKIYDPDEDTLTELIKLPTSTANGERGLVGVEVDPDFNVDGSDGFHKIYVAYTNGDNYDQLSKLTVNAGLTTVENEEVLLKSDQLGGDFHHGGELEFDPTGTYLYWAIGNNGVIANSTDLTNIHGKILRLNRDGSAPADNPYVNNPDPAVIDQIYAIGFRNPFRFGFTPDGHLLSGDVGEAAWEELNLVVAGGDYGWPEREGPCGSTCGDTIPPLYAYAHTLPPANVGSITSVLYYDGTTLPEEYRNKVFIADYSVGWIKMLTFDDKFESLIDEQTLDSSAGATVQLKQGPDGNIYQLAIYPGTLSIITASGGNKAPTANIGASQTTTDADTLSVDFTGAGSSDPDGDTLTYQWNFGNGQTSNQVAPTVTFTNTGANYTAYTVTLTVSDGAKTNTTTQRIVVGSTPPTATIGDIVINGTVGDHYNAGQTITFSGTGSDGQDGSLAPTSLEWKVVFHHNTHTHPFVDSIVGDDGSITIPTSPDQLASTWYRIYLTATDSSGLKTTVYKEVFPNTVDFTVNASDSTATFTVDGQVKTGSFTEKGVVGVERALSAPSTQHTSTGELIFLGWADGGPQTRTVTTPGSAVTYTANFGVAPV